MSRTIVYAAERILMNAPVRRLKTVKKSRVKMVTRLKVVRVGNKRYFFDERLRELRNIYDFIDSIQLNNFEVEHYRNAKGVKLNEERYFKKIAKMYGGKA